MKIPLETVFDELTFPNILVVGCGNIGSQIVRSFVDSDVRSNAKVYVTDVDKDRARKLSEYRLSSITPISWRSSEDTPDEVDIIVVAVDYESEHKILERLVDSKKRFVSLTDSAKVFDQYVEIGQELLNSSTYSILGTGLVPGLSDVLIDKCVQDLDKVLDISIQRLGFVSKTSLSSVKNALREQPLRVADGVIEEIKNGGGSEIYWFPPPWKSTECFPVGVGVRALQAQYGEVHSISVKYAEPKLPTFRERVNNIFLKTPLTTTRACIRTQAYGVKDLKIATDIRAVTGDAMSIIVATTLVSIIGLSQLDIEPSNARRFNFSVNEVVETNRYLNLLYKLGCDIMKFEPQAQIDNI